jgi:uncharacterized membrane protein
MKLVLLQIIHDSRRAFAFSVLCLAVCPSLATADYRYTRINVPGSVETQAFGINARGDIVGRYVGADGISHGFLRRSGVFTTIDVPLGFPGATAIATNSARSINARGDIIGGFVDSEFNEIQTYLLRDGEFTQIAFPGAIATVPGSINNAGDITGFFWGPTLDRQGGFIYKDGKFYRVNAPGGSEFVRSAQDNGRVLVGTSESNMGGFIRWKPGHSKGRRPASSAPATSTRPISRRPSARP